MRFLLAGAPGFIGRHCAKYLLERDDQVVGIDNINDHYDVKLKKAPGLDARMDFVSLQPGDVLGISADMKAIASWVDFTPDTSVARGVQNFVNRY